MSEHIHLEREQGLLTLRMDREDKKNALTRAMYGALADALDAADEDRSVRAVLITGSETCFTSGNDVADFIQAPPSGLDSEVFRFMKALFDFSKPVVAAVSGPAVGIGTTLLLIFLVYLIVAVLSIARFDSKRTHTEYATETGMWIEAETGA